jgi:hypothetical protein
MQFLKKRRSFVDQYLIPVEKKAPRFFAKFSERYFFDEVKEREIAKELPYDFG